MEAEFLDPLWDFYAVGSNSIVVDPANAGVALSVRDGVGDAVRSVAVARVTCKEVGAATREAAELSEDFTLGDVTGEVDVMEALTTVQNDIFKARAHHATRDANGLTSIHVVEFNQITEPPWWFGFSFTTASTMKDGPPDKSMGAYVPAGAEALANKWATVSISFDATRSTEGYMSVTAGEKLRFITNAFAAAYTDGCAEAIVLARKGSRRYVYGYVPLWVVADRKSYLPAATGVLKRKAPAKSVRFAADDDVDNEVIAKPISRWSAC